MVMGYVEVTYFILMNSSYGVIWARINHFETSLMVLSQTIDS